MCLKDTQNHTKSTYHTRTSVYRTHILHKPYHIFKIGTNASCHGISRSFWRNSNTAHGRDVFLSKGVLYLLKMNIQTISYNVVRCIMHKKDFNKPRNPAFSYANWHWPTTSKHRPIFFPLTAMIIWFHGTVTRTEVKNALFGPLELSSKANLTTNLFSPGFLRVSYG